MPASAKGSADLVAWRDDNGPNDDAQSVSTDEEEETLGQFENVTPDPNSYQMTGTVHDIDKPDRNNPLCVTAYVQEMYEHFRENEISTSVRPLYMETKLHFDENCRSILIDWMIEVHDKLSNPTFVPETLYLAVNLVDRYLELADVTRSKLQLVGVTCLLIATKTEEVNPPLVRDLVYVSYNSCSRRQVSFSHAIHGY